MPQLGEPMQHDGAVVSPQFSPDGRRVVTASEDNTAWLALQSSNHRNSRISATPIDLIGREGASPAKSDPPVDAFLNEHALSTRVLRNSLYCAPTHTPGV